MFSVILGALLPVIITLGLGMLAGWHKDQDFRAARSLNEMVLVYALPLALFAGTIVISKQELISEWPLLAALLVGTLLPYLAALFAARYLFGRDLASSALQALAFGFPAIAFTGIPILTPLIGNTATIVVDCAGLTGNIIILPATLILLSFSQAGQPGADGQCKKKDASFGTTLRRTLRTSLLQPVVLSPLLAVAVVLAGVHLPSVVSSSFKLLGTTVGGLSLFASGIILQSKNPGISLPAILSSVARLLLIPGLMYVALSLLGVSAELRKEAVLALGLAAAPMQVILSTRYKAAETENAATLLYTNVLCIPTLALFIWLTG